MKTPEWLRKKEEELKKKEKELEKKEKITEVEFHPEEELKIMMNPIIGCSNRFLQH
jgi:hypothetical protein